MLRPFPNFHSRQSNEQLAFSYRWHQIDIEWHQINELLTFSYRCSRCYGQKLHKCVIPKPTISQEGNHKVMMYGVVSGTSEACVWVTPTWLQRGCALNTIQYNTIFVSSLAKPGTLNQTTASPDDLIPIRSPDTSRAGWRPHRIVGSVGVLAWLLLDLKAPLGWVFFTNE